MLVSHRHRFIYTKTKKTAGTSVESYFERFCMPEGEWEEAHYRDEYVSDSGIIGFRGEKSPTNATWWNHMPAADIKRLLGDEVWNSYFKFCVVRNPYDKCISAFEHFGKRKRKNLFSFLGAFTNPGMTRDQRRFLDYVKRHPPVDRNTYVIDGEFCLDDVIRYEALEDGIAKICERLSLPFEPEYLPKFKKGKRRECATADLLYTPQSRSCVEESFEFEIKRFGYEYPAS
ncbi:MAG: sulfotransferase family 2 domain-containing protein [Planctomycetota bacterium]